MKPKTLLLCISCLLLFLGGCGEKFPEEKVIRPGKPGKGVKRRPATQRPYVIKGRTYYPIPSAEGYSEQGIASWYGKWFHGRRTANGETYDMYGHTAAHKTLPMHTMLLVKNLENNKSIVVRINDRGPFVRERIIDLTYSGARELGMIRNGTARVEIVALGEEVAQPEEDEPAVQPGKLVHPDFDQGNFYIQVGAFEQRNAARKLAELFADRGKDVIIQQYPAAGIRLYRVMVYSGTSLQRARKYETFLEQNGYPYALVIARDKG